MKRRIDTADHRQPSGAAGRVYGRSVLPDFGCGRARRFNQIQEAVTDYYATAIIEVAIDVFFWLKSRLTKRPPAAGRPSEGAGVSSWHETDLPMR